MNIEYSEEIEEKVYKIINEEFNKYASKNNIKCDYTQFVFEAKEDEKLLGLLTGHSYYKEVYIEDLIVYEENRNKHIGSKLVKSVEEHFKDSEFENINLTTYRFQAPEFYKKCGFEVEFVRKNKYNPQLDKYFLIKKLK